jgi:amino acid adenylation domain-containing protein
MHHIISDGWSLEVFIRELGTLYEAFLEGKTSPLPELPIQYADFAAWQREWQGEILHLEAQLAWWHERLAGAPALLELPTDRPRPPRQSFHGSTYRFTLEAPLIESMKGLARKEGATPFMALVASWAVVLSRHAGQDEVLLGAPVAGRNRTEIEDLIGFFVNTLVFRVNIGEVGSFTDLLRHVREVTLSAFAHQDVPFERIVAEVVQERRTLAHSPLFQAMIVLQNYFGDVITIPGLTLVPLVSDIGVAKFDLTLALQERGNQSLESSLEYRTDLFNNSTIARMAEHLKILIKGAVNYPDRPTAELPLLTELERFQIAVEWNDTKPTPLTEPLLHRRFQARAALCPNEVAVVHGEHYLTFAEVVVQAERLAVSLAAHGIGPGVLVGLRLRRSPELVVASLAVLMTGGAYLPLDFSDPDERQAWLLADSGARLVVASEAWSGAPVDTEVFVLPSEREPKLEDAMPLAEIDPNSLAYVLYTSGSTGRPKGVMVQHRALSRYLDWALQAYEVDAGQGAPVHSSLAFDLTVTSLWTPLLAGRTITLLPEERGVEALAATIRPGVNFSLVKLTPSHLNLLSQLASPESVRGWTQSLVVGGEALRVESLAFWRKHAPETRIFNEYGPTETVVGCSVYEVQDATAVDSLPIGRPISGSLFYVVARSLRIVPMGVIGELCIGGEGVTLGYLGNPSLTAERFIPDLFSNEPGSRMYRSGDLVRWRVDGNLEYIGRADGQVKIRGFRIELGEIEAALRSHPEVSESAVVVREDALGERRLAAYVAGTNFLEVEELRASLKRHLPDYMVPAAYVRLEALPLTSSGKIDRRALPPPKDPKEQAPFVPPRNLVEKKLAEIWIEVLGMERVGVEDNFFALGGDSLRVVQVIARVRGTLRIDLPLRMFFESPTIAGLSEQIRRTQVSPPPPELNPVRWESSAPEDTIQDEIEAVYEEMITLVQLHGKRPNLKEALRPLQEKLQALQEVEAEQIAERYDSHFRPDYERARNLITKARELIGKN